MYKTTIKYFLLATIFSTTLSLNVFAMDEMENNLKSAVRKVDRIKKNNERHNFEQHTLSVISDKKRTSAEWECKNCHQLKSNCFGFGGGKLEEAKLMAKELQTLLEHIESQK